MSSNRNAAARLCSIEGCVRPHNSRGWCHMHYLRWRSTGNPLLVKKPHRVDAADGLKLCASCRERKPLARFPPSRKAAYGRGSHCYDCRALTKRAQRYGITVAEYLALLVQQGDRCAICRRDLTVPHVDHCHDTGKVRGLLCSTCNSAIGLLLDDPEVIRRAAAYVEAHKTNPRAKETHFHEHEVPPREGEGRRLR